MRSAAPSLRRKCGARAVTLLELLVVLGLLVAIFAMAMPLVLQSMRGRALRSAQELLVAALESVRAHAQREGVIVELSVDASGRMLRASELPIDGSEARPIPALSFEIEAPMQLVVQEGGGTIAVFLPDGSAPMVRECVLRDPDEQSRDLAIVAISPLLGRPTASMRRVASADEQADSPAEEGNLLRDETTLLRDQIDPSSGVAPTGVGGAR